MQGASVADGRACGSPQFTQGAHQEGVRQRKAIYLIVFPSYSVGDRIFIGRVGGPTTNR
jgi:hypothetical protein